MSMYFDVGDETLWNPSGGAGRLFLRQVEVFEAELGLPSGIGQGRHWGDPDTLEIDPRRYAEFTRALVERHCRTGHFVIHALSEGFVATALALARRAGVEVLPPTPESGAVGDATGHDVPLPDGARTLTDTAVAALDTRARELDRHMAR
ncbi:DUF6086 family protein [Streptomyces sp. NPDC058867]|uniref:DUF6086 family protein n=1 Tax=unclassified Streptomyces TaxID=2593676 RepID=UPI0036B6F355